MKGGIRGEGRGVEGGERGRGVKGGIRGERRGGKGKGGGEWMEG